MSGHQGNVRHQMNIGLHLLILPWIINKCLEESQIAFESSGPKRLQHSAFHGPEHCTTSSQIWSDMFPQAGMMPPF